MLGPPFSYRGLVMWAYRNKVKWVRAGKARWHDQSAVMKKNWLEGKIVKASPEVAKKRGKAYAERLASGEQQHARGMLGKKHSAEFCAEQSRRNKQMVQDGTHHFQKKRTQKQLDAASRRLIERVKFAPNSIYSHARRGYRDDLGRIFFRSRWEANYARYLNLLIAQGHILRWEFEVDTFWFEKIRRGVRSYTPDFKVYGIDGSVWYEEVKGWMDKKSATKLKRMAKYYPSMTVRIVDEKAYKEITKKFSSVIPCWEN
jgi:hypothetical protein